ncbi:MAG: UvrD-helicase domain-containing protein [Luteibaculaceae bacterium]
MGNFQIYNASAGSGKTFSLVRAYLQIALHPTESQFQVTRFANILAITFTNKSTAEMKQRILRELKNLAKGEGSDMQNGLLEGAAIHKDELISRAKELYGYILHHYSKLSVSTIDSFNYKLVKGFAPEINLAGDFTVNLNPSSFYQRVFVRVLKAIETDRSFLEAVQELIAANAQDEKKENFESALQTLLYKIDAEDHRFYMSHFKPEYYDTIEQHLESFQAKFKAIKEELTPIAESFPDIFEKYGVVSSRNAAEKIPSKFATFNPEEWAEPKMYDSAKYIKKADLSGALVGDVEQALHKLEQIRPYCFPYFLMDVLKKQRFSLKLYFNMQAIIQQVKEEENFVNLSAFNHIISELIENENPEYIFEKIGNRYHHLLIDEFQDTSVMQWVNLFPLIANSLAGGNTVLIVGDPKQAIYRWRNGKVEQMVSLLNPAQPEVFHFNPEYHNPEIEQSLLNNREIIQLDTNYRSAREVVAFNNQVIESLLAVDPDFGPYYSGGVQKAFKADLAGYVSIYTTEPSDKGKTVKPLDFEREIKQIIESAVARGYNYSDITILTDSNKEQRLFADMLKAILPQVGFSSSDAGQVNENVVLKLLFTLLEFKLRRSGSIAQKGAELLYALHESFGSNKLEVYANFVGEDKVLNLPELVKHYYPDFDAEQYINLPVNAYFIHGFSVLDAENKFPDYLYFILDFCRQVEAAQGRVNFENLLAEWYLLDKESVSLPQNENAINGSTVHKAKGLEFPIVLYFLQQQDPALSRAEEIWVQNQYKEGKTLVPSLPENIFLPGNSSLKKMIPEQREISNYLTQKKIETANKLYVGFTRAERELYIFTKNIDGKPVALDSNFCTAKTFAAIYPSLALQGNTFISNSCPKSDNTLFYKHKTNVVSSNSLSYTIQKPSEFIPLSTYTDANPSLSKLSFRYTRTALNEESEAYASIIKGNTLHKILENLKDITDLERVSSKIMESEVFSAQEKETFLQHITAIKSTEHPLAGWFSREYTHWHERSIIDPVAQEIKRPDKIIVNTQGEALILDYKTGEPNAAHKKALMQYRNLLSEAGYTVKDCYLWYLKDGQLEAV